jgi:predicted house-cleaning noncanonical NTP pyrophosphatase (MazG superfamily)
MDTKTLVKALKMAVREVIKEELTEILREGLQSTINEMTQSKKPVKNETVRVVPKMVSESGRKPKVQFAENKWASVLNETDMLIEQNPSAMNSFADLMNESAEEMSFNSADVNTFAMNRQNMKPSSGVSAQPPAIMEDPETGKVYDVAPEVQQALTRDYSALMKAINRKKGN